MADDGVVQIDVGPTKAASAEAAAVAFQGNLFESSRTPQGLCLRFVVEEDDEDTIDQILGALSRIRALTIHWAGNQYTRREYDDIRLDLCPPDEDEPVPEEDKEFVAFAMACSSGGEWTAIEDGSYRDPEVRQKLLDIFACGEMREEILQAAREIWKSRTGLSQRQVQYALEARFSLPHFTMMEEAWYSGRLLQVERLQTALHRSNIVFIYPESRKCSVCNRMYTEPDGVTPRLFFLEEIEQPGANVGLPLEQWLPVLPPLHLHCACSTSFFTSMVSDLYEDTWGKRPLFITRIPSGERVPYHKGLLQEYWDWEGFRRPS